VRQASRDLKESLPGEAGLFAPEGYHGQASSSLAIRSTGHLFESQLWHWLHGLS